MQQAHREIVDLTAGSSPASNVNDSKRFEENLDLLCEMFPYVDIIVLKNHLRMFSDHANCMSEIVSILLDSQNSMDSVNHKKSYTQTNNTIKEFSPKVPSLDSGTKSSKNLVSNSSCSASRTIPVETENNTIEEFSPKVPSLDSGTKSSKNLVSNSSCSASRTVPVLYLDSHLNTGKSSKSSCKDSNNKDTTGYKQKNRDSCGSDAIDCRTAEKYTSSEHSPDLRAALDGYSMRKGDYTWSKESINLPLKRKDSDTNNSHSRHWSDSGVSPRKIQRGTTECGLGRVSESNSGSRFHRLHDCDVGRVQQIGVCIRHKNGALHPSMSKSKQLQIVQMGTDCKKHTSSPGKRNGSKWSCDKQSSTIVASTCTSTTLMTISAGENTFSNLGPSTSGIKTVKMKTLPSTAVPNVSAASDSQESFDNKPKGSCHNTKSKRQICASVLSDLEILKKVFPDANPEYISTLLEKHADEENCVAVVGRELGKSPNPLNQGVVKKKVPRAIVTWFWEAEDAKLVPFSEPECSVFEKEFNKSQNHQPCKLNLPGSSKPLWVNFYKMILCDTRGKESGIFRVPWDDDPGSSTEIRGRNLIPKEELAVPKDWQQQSNSAELISVRPGSAEWDHIEHSLKRSLKLACVTNIQRVQNNWLYRKYAIQRHLLKDKNGPTCINENELFHGTRTTNPALIWKGEDGFDMRYSADGMWGRGTYFAQQALYCHNGFTFYDREKQCYQLFLAHVLTGDSVTLPPDRQLRMPPQKPRSNIRYDSVGGTTNNSKVYIIYKLDMAYPAYLITYTMR